MIKHITDEEILTTAIKYAEETHEAYGWPKKETFGVYQQGLKDAKKWYKENNPSANPPLTLHQPPPHYQGLQPYDVMDAWYGEANLTAKEGHLIGDIIKRIARLNRKGQRGEDLDKIIHQTQLLKELWEEKEKTGTW